MASVDNVYFHDFLSDEISRTFKWRTVLPGDAVRLDMLKNAKDESEIVLVLAIVKSPRESYYDPTPRMISTIYVLSNNHGVVSVYNLDDPL